MSNFLERDFLQELHENIMLKHWLFLETEESVKKLEERRILEATMKDFLCFASHDRKFFLPQTLRVLSKSISEMNDFTAQKAMVGFEAISQYANNLFTKPWREEFRIVKLYSGFYQHEVCANLVDAEILFVEMGYRRVSEEMLCLEGPICPDQVMNVSRDAMMAYVECKIMKQIYMAMGKMGYKCSWKDVYTLREKQPGGATQAIHRLGYAMQHKYANKEKLVDIDNNYMPQTQPPAQCHSCAVYQQQPLPAPPPQPTVSTCPVHGPPICSCGASSPYSVADYRHIQQQQHHHQPNHNPAQAYQSHMTHSRSMDQPASSSSMHSMAAHRHSFEHPQAQAASSHHHHHHPQYQQIAGAHVYESPYDCLDGGGSMNSSVSYAAVAGGSAHQPYNVSGNRYPLPLNMSDEFGAQYGVTTPDAYANVEMNGQYAPSMKSCAMRHQQVQHQQQTMMPPMPPARQQSSVNATRDLAAMRQQRSFPPDHLIDFDERAVLASNDFHALAHHSSLDYERSPPASQRGGQSPAGPNRGHTLYAQPKDALRYGKGDDNAATPDNGYDNCTYAKPTPRSERSKTTNTTDKYLATKTDNIQDIPVTVNNRKVATNGVRRKTSTHTADREESQCSGESMYTDNFDSVDSSGEQASNVSGLRSPTQAVKNQDGVGSFESWNYVFKNLEQSGYTKDLGEREDLLVKSLDLGAMHLGDKQQPADKRRPSETKTAPSRHQVASVATNTETPREEPPPAVKPKEKSILKHVPQQAPAAEQQPTSTGAIKKQKSALKSTASTIMTTVTPPTPTNTMTQDNNNRNLSVMNGRSSGTRGKSRTTITKATPNAAPPWGTTEEWDCPRCTFRNPTITKRICEMCSLTNFAIEPSLLVTSTHKPTCV